MFSVQINIYLQSRQVNGLSLMRIFHVMMNDSEQRDDSMSLCLDDTRMNEVKWKQFNKI